MFAFPHSHTHIYITVVHTPEKLFIHAQWWWLPSNPGDTLFFQMNLENWNCYDSELPRGAERTLRWRQRSCSYVWQGLGQGRRKRSSIRLYIHMWDYRISPVPVCRTCLTLVKTSVFWHVLWARENFYAFCLTPSTYYYHPHFMQNSHSLTFKEVGVGAGNTLLPLLPELISRKCKIKYGINNFQRLGDKLQPELVALHLASPNLPP